MANKEREEKKQRHFLKDFKAELKRVVWPTPKQLLNSTIAVVTIVLVIGFIVFLLDFGFEFLNSKNSELQSKVQNTTVTTDSEETEESDTTSEEESDEASKVEESSENAETEESNS